ncbi:MAG TPA: DUF3349 domain-containing protein [Streptosporangiaceae bacterium]|jgi:hypothetical protein|nr:DUF3349 domain-containing protein [Streptosporangiaceae bacterium]
MPNVLQLVINWLRAGYPDGVPSTDYIPLFALLGTQLTDVELLAVADELAGESVGSLLTPAAPGRSWPYT